MLYDDVNQVEVRYVISLAHHDVTIYGGEGDIPEGELWLKRNAICLSRRLASLGDLGGPTPPFYLFSENLSEKEDFYIAMLQNQNRLWDSSDRPPKHQEFDTKHIVTLVRRLHSSEEQLQTRWINAFLGRWFLAMYRTPELEEFVRSKIVKKISRANKPNFISKIGLQRIDMGEGAPFITNPRLKDLTVDGNCCVEADMQYTGNFRVEISATVRIDLGPRFKAREVDIVLAVVLKNLKAICWYASSPHPAIASGCLSKPHQRWKWTSNPLSAPNKSHTASSCALSRARSAKQWQRALFCLSGTTFPSIIPLARLSAVVFGSETLQSRVLR
jgi:Putative integral membrane protein conserved region (DUF2404).